MSERCPVVIIRTPLGPTRINEADFDKSRHVLWEDKPVAAPVVKPVTPRVAEIVIEDDKAIPKTDKRPK